MGPTNTHLSISRKGAPHAHALRVAAPMICSPMLLAQKRCILRVWLLKNTNRKRQKPHAGSRTHWRLAVWKEVYARWLHNRQGPVYNHLHGIHPSNSHQRVGGIILCIITDITRILKYERDSVGLEIGSRDQDHIPLTFRSKPWYQDRPITVKDWKTDNTNNEMLMKPNLRHINFYILCVLWYLFSPLGKLAGRAIYYCNVLKFSMPLRLNSM